MREGQMSSLNKLKYPMTRDQASAFFASTTVKVLEARRGVFLVSGSKGASYWVDLRKDFGSEFDFGQRPRETKDPAGCEEWRKYNALLNNLVNLALLK